MVVRVNRMTGIATPRTVSRTVSVVESCDSPPRYRPSAATYATLEPVPAPDSSNGCPMFLPLPATRNVWFTTTRRLGAPRWSSHPAAVDWVIARRDSSEPFPFWVVSTVSVHAAPSLSPSLGRRGRKSRKLPSSCTAPWASTLSEGTEFTKSPRGATRPMNTSFRTLLMLSAIGLGAAGAGAGVGVPGVGAREPPQAARSATASSIDGSGFMGLPLRLGAPEDGYHFRAFAGHAQQLPSSLPHVGPPPDELLPFLGGRTEYPQVRYLLPMCRVGLRGCGH